jgi:hypothetical protein
VTGCMRDQWAKEWMARRCAASGPCPLKHPTAPVQRLSGDDAFTQAVLKACSRLDCDQKILAVLASQCPNP